MIVDVDLEREWGGKEKESFCFWRVVVFLPPVPTVKQGKCCRSWTDGHECSCPTGPAPAPWGAPPAPHPVLHVDLFLPGSVGAPQDNFFRALLAAGVVLLQHFRQSLPLGAASLP